MQAPVHIVRLSHPPSAGSFFNDLFAFDIAGLTWHNMTVDVSGSVPEARNGHGFLSFRGNLYLFGGFTYPGACLTSRFSLTPL